MTQWLEAVQRDCSHPSIVGWCPLNESENRIHEFITPHDDVMRAMWLATKLADPTRPVLDVSGYCYTQLTDVYQEQNGIYTFDRKTKYDLKRVHAAQVRVAAIEK